MDRVRKTLARVVSLALGGVSTGRRIRWTTYHFVSNEPIDITNTKSHNDGIILDDGSVGATSGHLLLYFIPHDHA